MKNTQTQNLLSELNAALPYELDELITGDYGDAYEYCHSHAEGSENVIWYHKAEKLYTEASTSERDNAEMQVEDTGGFEEGANQASRFCTLAFWIECQRIQETLREQSVELLEKLEAALENSSFRSKWVYVAEDLTETLEAI